MSGSVNKVILLGRVGAEPEIRTTQSGSKVANLRLATSEKWKDKNSGEQKENTEWSSVVVWGDALVGVVEKYVGKGNRLYIEGKLQTRKWQDQSGSDRYTTEVVVQGFGGSLTLIDFKDGDTDRNAHANREADRSFEQSQGGASFSNDLNDSIPFGPEWR